MRLVIEGNRSGANRRKEGTKGQRSDWLGRIEIKQQKGRQTEGWNKYRVAGREGAGGNVSNGHFSGGKLTESYVSDDDGNASDNDVSP